MKGWRLGFCVFFAFVVNGLSQTSSPTPQTNSGNRGGQSQPTGTNSRQNNQDINAAFDNLRSVELRQNAPKGYDRILNEEIQPLYRKPSKKELKNLLPSPALLTQFEKFLQQPDTGIFKLSADSDCAVNPQVVVAKENCLSNDIPGAGTAYSFRVKSYRMLHLSDLVLENNVIKTGSLLQQGIMVKLGDIDLDKISEQSAGMKFLVDYQPSITAEDLQAMDEKLAKGIKSDNFTYGLGFYVADKTTYALRSIAYRSKMMRSVSGVKYNEMDFDKRIDILVVFRIIEKEENGDLTILWKEIVRKESPTFKIESKTK